MTTVLALAFLLVGPPAEDSYEWRRTRGVLEREKLTVDRAPEGKRIAWVRIVRDNVFVGGEAFPVWLNMFHVKTREFIIKRELLLGVGDRYVDARIEESMRILRGMGKFALVRIVGVKTENDDEIGLLVHTRDLWSLRLETRFNISSQINSLNIKLVERNVAGIGHTASIPFSLSPATFVVGQSYGTRRTFGRPVSVGESGGLVFNRDSGRPEGGSAGISAGRPFFNLAEQHAVSISASYSNRIRRQLANGQPQVWVPEGGDQGAALRIWRQQNVSGKVGYSRRMGDKRKHTFSFSFFANDRYAKPIDETRLNSEFRDAFADQVMPPSRRQIGPSIAYNMFVPRFHVFTNLNTYGQSENVRLGPKFTFGMSAPMKMFGSSVEARTTSASFSWTFAPLGGLVRLSTGPSMRWQEGDWTDQRVVAQIRVATPLLWKFRIIARTRLGARWNDTSNSQVSLGSDGALRGYPSDYLVDFGANTLVTNVELRTVPIETGGVLIGGVIFYDMGSVFKEFDQIDPVHGFGVGLRILLPQLNRVPWTLDAGFNGQSFAPIPTLRSGQVISAG
jgi:hypothetical protein